MRCVFARSDTLAVGHNDGSLSIIDAQTLTPIVNFKDRKEEISDAKFSPGMSSEERAELSYITNS